MNLDVLEERTRRVARPVTPKEAGGAEHLVVTISGHRVAIAAEQVERVLPATPVAALPGVGQPWVGVTTYRGRLLGVLDLGPSLGGTAPSSRQSLVVLATARGRPAVGLAVDEVAGVGRSAGSISAVEPTRPWIEGVSGDGALLIDIDRLVNDAASGRERSRPLRSQP